MSNIVNGAGKAGNAVAALGNLKQGIANVVETLKVSKGGEYLVLTKSGKWVAGQAKTKIDPETRWAMNIPSLEHGWTCWDRGEDAETSKGPLGEVMVSLWTPLPSETSLKDYGNPWTQQLSVEFTGVGGVDNGRKIIYKVNSKGGIPRMKELLNTISDTSTEAAPVPLIQFGADSYNHKRYGEIITPVFRIVGWTDPMGESLADQDGVVEDAPDATVAYAPEPEEDEDERLMREIEARRAVKLAAQKAANPAEAGAPVRRRNR